VTAFLIAARRSAVMPRNGAFRTLEVQDLAAPVIRACLWDAGLDVGQVDELVLSNALGAGGNPARLAALSAGLPERVAGLSIDRQCAGGLDAIRIAEAMITSGQAQVVIAGGAESWSRRPLRFRTDPAGGAALAYEQPPFVPWPDRDPDMTVAAAALADSLGISRADQDRWAIKSHSLAIAARDRLAREIVVLPQGSRDLFARNLTPQLAARTPVLTGTVTAATTAVAADAAAFVVVVSPEIARKAGRAIRIMASATLGSRPEEPGLAPIPAIAATLSAAGLAPQKMERSEVMEAFAVQAIACVQAAGLDPARVNLGGGALARGHPIGASGAILAVRLFHDLEGGTGLAAIAAAGGIGSALILSA
jgi:acetyl-CoA C-acetyltransferase